MDEESRKGWVGSMDCRGKAKTRSRNIKWGVGCYLSLGAGRFAGRARLASAAFVPARRRTHGRLNITANIHRITVPLDGKAAIVLSPACLQHRQEMVLDCPVIGAEAADIRALPS